MDRVNISNDSLRSVSLVFPLTQVKLMLEHVSLAAPEEACGLVAGLGNTALMVLPITNLLHSPVRFRMSPQEQLKAFILIDEAGLDLLAIYHSHPYGPETPSSTDVAEAYYPEAYSIIWAGAAADWSFRCFSIQNGEIREVQTAIQTL